MIAEISDMSATPRGTGLVAAAAAASVAVGVWLLRRHLVRSSAGGKQSPFHVPPVDAPTLYVGKLRDGQTAVRVRPAFPGVDGPDGGTVFRFVELLADDLNSRPSLHNSEQDLSRDLAAGKISALLVETIATAGSAVVAAAVFYEAYSTWDGPFLFLEDIVVLPEFRGQGIGTILFKELAALAARRGYRRFQWESLASNSAANKWYSGEIIHAKRKSEIVTWRLEESGMSRLSLSPS